MKGTYGVHRWLIGVALLGLTVMAGALLVPLYAAQGGDEQLYLLQLAEPEMPPLAVHSWPQAVDLYQDAWAGQQAAIVHHLAALQAVRAIRAFEVLPEGNAILVETTEEQAARFKEWMGVSHVLMAGEEARAETLAAWRSRLQHLWQQQATAAMLTIGPLTVNFNLDRVQVSGVTDHPDTIHITLMDSDGKLLAKDDVDPFPNAGGYLYAVILSPSDGSHRIPWQAVIGDVLTIRQGAEEVTLEVPPLTALADQLQEIVYGQASPGGELTIIRYHDSAASQQTTTADAIGGYELPFPGLFPPDYGYVYHRLDERRQVGRRFNVPYLRIGTRSGEVTGMLAPNATFTITVKTAAGESQYQTTIFTSSEGAFHCPCYLWHIEPGYTILVEGIQTIRLTVPLLIAWPDAVTGYVTGRAPPETTLSVTWHGAREDIGYYCYEGCWLPSLDEPDYTLTVTSSPTGTYEADFSDLTTLMPGDYGAVTYTDPAGHQFHCHYGLPRIAVYPEQGVYGEFFAPNAPLTVTVTGNSGYLKDIIHVYSNYCGEFPWYKTWEDTTVQQAEGGYRPWPRLQPGDQIRIESPEEAVELKVPTITLHAERETGLISGQAPPDTPLRITLFGYGPKPTPTPSPPYPLGGSPTADRYLTRYVTSTPSGSYSADFSELAPLQPFDRADLRVTVGGHYVNLAFLSLVPLLRVDLDEGSLFGYVDAPGIRLLICDKEGNLKTTMTALPSYGTFAIWLPFLEPGDTIEVEGGRQPLRITLPHLSVRADQAANRINGEAPPGSVLTIELTHFLWPPFLVGTHCPWPLCWPTATHAFTAIATAAGDFTVNLGETVQLIAGDRGNVTYRTADGNEIIVHYAVPQLSPTLGTRTIYGYGLPNSPVTITVASVAGEIKGAYRTHTSPNGYFDIHTSSPTEPGDWIVLTGEAGERLASLTTPLLTAQIDPTGQVVSGQAPPNALLGISLYRQDVGPFAFSTVVTSTPSGEYGVNLGEGGISAGDVGSVLYRTPEGHLVSTSFGLPRLEVTLEEPMVTGHWSRPTPWNVTATLLHPDGRFKGSASSVSTYYSSRFYLHLMTSEGEAAPVQSGDILIVSNDSDTITMVVPTLTVEANAGSRLILGQALPRKLLEITLDHKGFPYGGKYIRQTWSDITGTYGLDLGEIVLWPRDYGSVSFADSEGNTITALFSVSNFTLYYPLMLKDKP